MSLSKFGRDRGPKRITHGFYFMLRKQNLVEPRAVVYLRRDRVGLNAGKRGGTNRKIGKKKSRPTNFPLTSSKA